MIPQLVRIVHDCVSAKTMQRPLKYDFYRQNAEIHLRFLRIFHDKNANPACISFHSVPFKPGGGMVE